MLLDRKPVMQYVKQSCKQLFCFVSSAIGNSHAMYLRCSQASCCSHWPVILYRLNYVQLHVLWSMVAVVSFRVSSNTARSYCM